MAAVDGPPLLFTLILHPHFSRTNLVSSSTRGQCTYQYFRRLEDRLIRFTFREDCVDSVNKSIIDMGDKVQEILRTYKLMALDHLVRMAVEDEGDCQKKTVEVAKAQSYLNTTADLVRSWNSVPDVDVRQTGKAEIRLISNTKKSVELSSDCNNPPEVEMLKEELAHPVAIDESQAEYDPLQRIGKYGLAQACGDAGPSSYCAKISQAEYEHQSICVKLQETKKLLITVVNDLTMAEEFKNTMIRRCYDTHPFIVKEVMGEEYYTNLQKVIEAEALEKKNNTVRGKVSKLGARIGKALRKEPKEKKC